jgi:hypothetical protein
VYYDRLVRSSHFAGTGSSQILLETIISRIQATVESYQICSGEKRSRKQGMHTQPDGTGLERAPSSPRNESSVRKVDPPLCLINTSCLQVLLDREREERSGGQVVPPV